MVGIVAHFLQVVVLAAHAQTFLAVAGARELNRVVAQDDILKLVHSGVGKHQRRVILYNHRSRGYYTVVLGGKIVQKGLTYFFTCHYFRWGLRSSNFSVDGSRVRGACPQRAAGL